MPAVGPSKSFARACPDESVATLVGEIVPPPCVTANWITDPATGTPLRVTVTTSEAGRIEPEVADCPSPDVSAIVGALADVPDARNVIGEPARPDAVAV